MRKHRRRRHKQEQFVNFVEHLSIDMLVYLLFLGVNIWKSIKTNEGKGNGLVGLIPFAFDFTILIVTGFLIFQIYKRNQDEERSTSRSDKIIALFCIILLIAAIKMFICL
jgi:hypothetical protein